MFNVWALVRKIEERFKIRFPRTLHGWKFLFWITIRCCPIHHTPTCIDAHPTGSRTHRYCFKCNGVGVWAGSALRALRENYNAYTIRNHHEGETG